MCHEYILDGTKIIREEFFCLEDSSVSPYTLDFLYDAFGDVTGFIYDNCYYYYQKNIQGDVIRILDRYGNSVTEYTYDSWGKVLSTSGSLASIIGEMNPFRYRSYYYDKETGLYYLNSRYYDPEVGRFLNSDDIDCLGADGSIPSYNLFAYCMNNPVNRFDINGNWSWPNWAKKVVAAVAVVATVATVAAVTVATAGAGTAAAVIAVGAAKGAAIGMVSGAAIGAATGAVSHRVSTGSWNGADTAALNGMGDGALSGAVTGALSGAAGSAVKVGRAAKAWDSSSKGGPWKNMSDHYKRHVLLEHKKSMTKNVITYTNDALALWDKSNRVGQLMKSGSLKLKAPGAGGFYSQTGLVRSFFYQ